MQRASSSQSRIFGIGYSRWAPCVAAAAILGASAAGCGDSDGGEATGAPPPPESVCSGDARPMKFAVGLEQASADASVKVRFVEANPAPPGKGDNTLTVDILDGAGAPISGATVTVTPFMPDHGHGGAAVSAIASSDPAGRYSAAPVTLFMPGVWDVTFTVEVAGGPIQTVVFTFCIEG